MSTLTRSLGECFGRQNTFLGIETLKKVLEKLQIMGGNNCEIKHKVGTLQNNNWEVDSNFGQLALLHSSSQTDLLGLPTSQLAINFL